MKKQSELINEYLYYGRKQRKLDEKTIRAYRINLEQFSDFSEQEEIVMSREVIRQYILHLHDIYKQKTVKRKIASLKAFYSYLEEEEIIEDSPMRKVRTEFREEKVLPRTIPYSTLEMLNLHVTPHMFRHAFATLLLEEEVDIRFIQKMLGHASITTTQIYAEVAAKKQMEILRMKHPRNRMNI